MNSWINIRFLLFFSAMILQTSGSCAQKGHFILQGGVFSASQGRSQQVNIQGLIGDQFTLTHQYDQNGLFGVGYLRDGLDQKKFSVLYGINAFYLGHTLVNGYVIQEEINKNLSYQYHLTNYPIYATAKILIKSTSEYYHWIGNIGLGANIIQANAFQERSLDGGITLPDKIFSSRTSASWSTTVGLGLRFNRLFSKCPVELGYRYFYLGQGRLHPLTKQTSNLNTGRNYANALMVSVFI